MLLWTSLIPFKHVTKNMVSRSRYNLKNPLESVVWGKSVLAEPGPHMVFIGPSTTFTDFPSELMAQLFKNYRIQDFTLNGLNITQSAKILELLTAEIPREKRTKSLFIVSLYYGSFNAGTDGRYSISDPLESVPSFLHEPVRLVMEYIMAVRFSINALIQYWYVGDIEAHKEKLRILNNSRVLTDADKQKDLLRIAPRRPPAQYFGNKFDVLRGMVKKAAEDGIRLVLVDMPHPAWVLKQFPHDAIYQEKLKEMRPLLDKLGVPLINMRDLKDEDLFCDWAHARPRTAPIFCSYLAEALRCEVLGK
jgi:hypothetical protein